MQYSEFVNFNEEIDNCLKIFYHLKFFINNFIYQFGNNQNENLFINIVKNIKKK
jgi:hypothetical protein